MADFKVYPKDNEVRGGIATVKVVFRGVYEEFKFGEAQAGDAKGYIIVWAPKLIKQEQGLMAEGPIVTGRHGSWLFPINLSDPDLADLLTRKFQNKSGEFCWDEESLRDLSAVIAIALEPYKRS